MSTLESVCASADGLAEQFLRYLALRQDDPLVAARLRKKLGLEAVALRANIALARAKRDAALAAKPLSQWTRSGPIPLPPRPANDITASMGGTIG